MRSLRPISYDDFFLRIFTCPKVSELSHRVFECPRTKLTAHREAGENQPKPGVMMKSTIVLAFAIAFVSGIVFLRLDVAAQSVPTARPGGAQIASGQTVGQRFKNIQVLTDLKDAPASELYNTMQFISGSLSVSCNYCHVSQQGPFESDAKRTKLIARDMIRMMRAINQNNFDGRPVVTCNTCHRGNAHPNGTPGPWYKTPEEIAAYNQAMQPAASNVSPTGKPESPIAEVALPDTDQVMAKYRKAVGAVPLKSISVSGTNVVAMGGTASFEAYALFPNKILVSSTNRGTEVQTILNGDRGWRVTPQGKYPLPPESLGDVRARFEYLLLPVKYEKSDAPRRVKAIERIGDRSYYVVESHAGNRSEQLYFDAQSGLLYQARTEIETRLGIRVEEKTFEDYRDVNGLRLPYLISNHYMEDQSQFKISEIRINIDIDPARFEPPASKER